MNSTPEWAEVEKLFFAALEVPAAERARWIETAAPDAALAAEVRSLVESHEAAAATSRPLVGPYRLERPLGRGGMGEVWLASRADGQFEQRVALKLIRSGLGMEALGTRFRQERQVLARLNHAHIAHLLDGGVTADGRPYLAMEYVEGQPLLEYCSDRGLDTRARLELFRTLCGAVEYAHQRLVVHRDIKPGNVLVTAAGDPKLLDFGIAKLVEADGSAAETATAAALLTPRYASPEQVHGEPVTTAGDIYSLGVLLFEMLTGELPYHLESESLPAILNAIDTQEPRLASGVKRDGQRSIPAGDLDAILAKTLQKQPARRYASVERLSADLSDYLAGRPVSARSPTTAYRLGKYVRRHWAGVSAATLAIAALAASAALAIHSAQVANRLRERAERTTSFLEDILNPADPGWHGAALRTGPDMKLADVLDAARARIDSAFAGDRAAQGELHAALGFILTNLGRFDAAEVETRAALERAPALKDEPLQQARAIYASGFLALRHGSAAVAEARFRQALAIYEASPECMKDVATHAIMLSDLSVVLSTQEKRAAAMQAIQSAIAAMRGMASPPVAQLGILEANLAQNELLSGRLERARMDGRRAVETLASSPQPLMELGYAAMNLGVMERISGDQPAALQYFRQSVEVSRRLLGPEHPLTLGPRIQLAYQRARMGEAADAETELTECLALARQLGSRSNTWYALTALGYALTAQGRAEEAEGMLREAVAIAAQIFPPNDPAPSETWLVMAECLYSQGRRQEALPLYQSALHTARSLFGEGWLTRQITAEMEAAAR